MNRHWNVARWIASAASALALSSCGGAQSPSATPVVVANANVVASPPQIPERRTAALPPLPETPDAPFRQSAPAPGQTPAFSPPVINRFTLRNGMTVMLVERHDLPIVVARYISRRGSDDVPVARAGLGQLVGTLIEQGTARMGAIDFAGALASIGAEHGSSVQWDHSAAFIKVLANQLPRAMELLADEIQRPAFAESEFTRERDQQRDALRQVTRDSPPLIGAITTYRAVYPANHPYSRPLLGTDESLQALTRNDVVAFHRSHYVPSDSALVVIGDVTRAALQPLLDQYWTTWNARSTLVRATPPSPPATAMPRISLVDRPRAPQSYVLVAQVGVPRSSPDYIPIQVMNTLLGGMFSSRINLNLREAHAYTYGARSMFGFRRLAGPFTAGGAIIAAHTGPAVREILNELNRIRSSNVEPAELAAAQSRLAETLPSVFEGGEATSLAVGEIFVFRLPLDEYATLSARVAAVTIADVRRVAERYIDAEHSRIIVIGDHASVTPQLEALNLGAIEARNAHGDLVAAATAPGATTPPSTPTTPH